MVCCNLFDIITIYYKSFLRKITYRINFIFLLFFHVFSKFLYFGDCYILPWLLTFQGVFLTYLIYTNTSALESPFPANWTWFSCQPSVPAIDGVNGESEVPLQCLQSLPCSGNICITSAS